ncbi:MAG: hypothetical protein K1X88_22720 [Nannocystaceae bacterium]|nr:hypothetical protein [Nannocystaceae bacterium]
MSQALTRKQFLHLGLGATAATLLPGCPGGDDGDGGSSDASSSGGGSSSTTASTTATTATTTESTGGSSGGDSSSGGGSGETGVGACSDDPNAMFDLHFHSLDVPLADVVEGTDKSYVSGGAHTHDVMVNAAAFASLVADGQVIVTSGPGGTDGHTHIVTLSCP